MNLRWLIGTPEDHIRIFIVTIFIIDLIFIYYLSTMIFVHWVVPYVLHHGVI
jgi:hypothetical protein